MIEAPDSKPSPLVPGISFAGSLGRCRAGEAGGSLHDTLQRLSDYLERSQELKGRVINALIYPAILLAVVGCGPASLAARRSRSSQGKAART